VNRQPSDPSPERWMSTRSCISVIRTPLKLRRRRVLLDRSPRHPAPQVDPGDDCVREPERVRELSEPSGFTDRVAIAPTGFHMHRPHDRRTPAPRRMKSRGRWFRPNRRGISPIQALVSATTSSGPRATEVSVAVPRPHRWCCASTSGLKGSGL